MVEDILARLFEHNNWANSQIIQACIALTEEQLKAEPVLATKGSIHETLRHLVDSQEWYLFQLTSQEPKFDWQELPGFEEMQEAAEISGEALLALARDLASKDWGVQYQAKDGYRFDPWVVMVQSINHATEHREQIKSMLSALGIAPPRVDGWGYGRSIGAVIPPPAADDNQRSDG